MENQKFIVWSVEHEAWWMDREDGYTPFRRDAGVYSYKDACRIVASANRGLNDTPNEAMIPYVDFERVEKMQREMVESDRYDLATAHK